MKFVTAKGIHQLLVRQPSFFAIGKEQGDWLEYEHSNRPKMKAVSNNSSSKFHDGMNRVLHVTYTTLPLQNTRVPLRSKFISEYEGHTPSNS